MVIRDNELCMLEQLCYLNGQVAQAAGIIDFNGINDAKDFSTINQILEKFDEEALKKLEIIEEEVCDACISGKEWAGIIRYLQTSRLKDLVLVDTLTNVKGDKLALCFIEEGNSTEAIVAFKGTTGSKEWVDNVQGLNQADTIAQQEALVFIEDLPYDSIVVTGHSKGGNKAMYVAITSSKVERCVSFDGQGFSAEFMKQYWNQIQQRGNNIINYALSNDYVNILMLPVINSNKLYSMGHGVDNVKQYHSPNSFFNIDSDGNIIRDFDGIPVLIESSKEESLQILEDFVRFLIYNATEEDMDIVVKCMSSLVEIIFAEKKESDLTEESISDKLKDFISTNSDEAVVAVAYFIKYMDEYDLGQEDIENFLEVLDINQNLKSKLLVNLLLWMMNPDTDKEFLLRNIILFAVDCGLDLEISLRDFANRIVSKVKQISTSNTSGTTSKIKIYTSQALGSKGAVRDFSSKVHNTLTTTSNTIESINRSSFSSWKRYVNEEWYSSLHVSSVINTIDTYFSDVSETNRNCKSRISIIFEEVKLVDNEVGQCLKTSCNNLKSIKNNITKITDKFTI